MCRAVLVCWKHVFLKNKNFKAFKLLLLFPPPVGEENQYRLEFGLHAEYVQHDPIRSENNPPYEQRRLRRPHLSVFSANNYNCCLNFHHHRSHLLLSIEGIPSQSKASGTAVSHSCMCQGACTGR